MTFIQNISEFHLNIFTEKLVAMKCSYLMFYSHRWLTILVNEL